MSLYSGLPSSLECKWTVSLLVYALRASPRCSGNNCWMDERIGRKDFSQPFKQEVNIWSRSSTSGYTSGENSNSKRCTHLCVHYSTIYDSQHMFSSLVSDSLWPHGLLHARLPCPLPAPGACSNSCPLSQWCHPTISSSILPFSSCLQSFPASRSFPMSQFFTAGGQNTGVSAPASVLPMNIQDWFPLGLTGWISLLSKGLSRVFSNTTVQKPTHGSNLNIHWQMNG